MQSFAVTSTMEACPGVGHRGVKAFGESGETMGAEQGRDFRGRYCRATGRKADGFDLHVFWRSLTLPALPLAVLLFPVTRRVFAEEFLVIRHLGDTEDPGGFHAELRHYLATRRSQTSLFKRWLRLRLSGRRVLKLMARGFGDP